MKMLMLSEEEYLLAMRQCIDELRARADMPRYKYATEDQPTLVAYFLKRGAQFGEAAFRTKDLTEPLDVLVRVLCDDLIRLSWITQSENNADDYAKQPISALAKVARTNTEKGHARIVHGPTGKDVSAVFLPKIASLEVRGKSTENMANECGLDKVYNIVFRPASLPMHAKTFKVNDSDSELAKDALTTLPAINAFLKAVALIADRFPKVVPAGEIIRTLGMNLGG